MGLAGNTGEAGGWLGGSVLLVGRVAAPDPDSTERYCDDMRGERACRCVPVLHLCLRIRVYVENRAKM